MSEAQRRPERPQEDDTGVQRREPAAKREAAKREPAAESWGAALKHAAERKKPAAAKPKEAPASDADFARAADRDVVKHYQPRFLKDGGEHVVYELPKKKWKKVAKVDFQTVRQMRKLNRMAGYPEHSASPQALERAEMVMADDRARQARLEEHFGADNVARQREFLVELPMTQEVWNQVDWSGGNVPDEKMMAITKIVDFAPEMADENGQSVYAGMIEKFRGEKPDYERVMRGLVEDGGSKADADELMKFYDPKRNDAIVNPGTHKVGMDALLAVADVDDEVRAALSDFTRKAIDYANTFREPLDLGGPNNVTMALQDDKWRYRLHDAGMRDARILEKGEGDLDRVASAAEAARKVAKGEQVDAIDASNLFLTAHFARTVNALAAELGLKERFTFVPDEAKGKIDWLALARKTGVAENAEPKR